MKAYRALGVLLVALACGTLTADEFRISPRFRTVYIVSMNNSFDQYLANRLTNAHVLWVVLDPSSADAVLTDSLDENFWNWLSRTYPPEPGVSDKANTIYRSTSGPTARQRGTIFLVDPRRRLVLWAAYELPRDTSPTQLDRSAERITNQLKVAYGKR